MNYFSNLLLHNKSVNKTPSDQEVAGCVTVTVDRQPADRADLQ